MPTDAQPQLAPAKPKRRWWQYGVGTMLVVVTVLGVALGVVASRAERQRKAVAAIEALGGHIYYNDVEPFARGETPPMHWLPRDWVATVFSVRFDETAETDAALIHLRGLTGLRMLTLNFCDVSDAELRYLQGTTGLWRLELDGTPVTDAGLVNLQGLTQLRHLSLSNTRVTDAGLAHLDGLTRLTRLRVDRTAVTDAGVAELRKALPDCEVVRDGW